MHRFHPLDSRRYAAFVSDSMGSATRSATSNRQSVTPAAIAGNVRSAAE
jgi:hypothetical protein